MVDYKQLHENASGPGDGRPKALQVVEHEGLKNAWKGRVVVITGCSSGIGIETARAFAATGATIIATARNLNKAREALQGIGSEGQLQLVQVDQASLDSVRAGAKQILELAPKINVLIANAGIMATPYEKTKDGFESQFGVNHLSHFLLFELLRPALQAAAKETPGFASRVVSVSSTGHRLGKPDFNNLNFDKPGSYDKWVGYGASKTANVWFANQIDRLFGSSKDGAIHAFSLQPGVISSGLVAHLPKEETDGLLESLKNVPLKTPEQGAATSTFAAAAKELEGKGGKFLEDCQIIGPNDGVDPMGAGYGVWAYSREDEARLWQVSNTLVGL